MKLQKLKQIVEFGGMYSKQIENLLIRVLDHRFVEGRIFAEQIPFYLILSLILGLNEVNFSGGL